MSRRIVLGMAGLLVMAGVSLPSSAAAAGGNSGPKSGDALSTTLQSVSQLPRRSGAASTAYHGYIPLNAQAYARAKAAANRRAGVGSAAGTSGSSPAVPSSYANVSSSFEGIFQTGLTPPDTTGAKGPDRYIEAINLAFEIYDTRPEVTPGTKLGGGTLSDLTGVSGGYGLSDPQMMWDPTTQRFYYTAVYYDSTMTTNGLAIGWSQTASPTSASDFCKYFLSFPSFLPDYPKLGDSGDYLMIGFNQFVAGLLYTGSQFAMINKPPSSTSNPGCADAGGFTITYSGVLASGSTGLETPVPANLVDSNASTGYVVASPDLSSVSSANFVSVFAVNTQDNNGTLTPVVTGPVDVPVQGYSLPANAPQKGSSYLLDTLDGRFEAAVAASDPSHGGKVAIWTAHAVSGTSDGNAGVEERWYEIDPAGSLLQHGTVGASTLSVWNGSISPDRADNGTAGKFGGDMAMSVSTSSPSTYPAIQFVSKAAGDPTQSALQNLVQSGGANVDHSCSSTSACRWGDYSGASPDPAAVSDSSGRIWLDNQYNLAGGTTSSTSWRTWVFQVTPAPAPSAALSFTSGPQSLTAGAASSPMTVSISSAAPFGGVSVSLASSDGIGVFSPAQVSISAGQTVSEQFTFTDTKAGTPTITASASGASSATQQETVNPDLSSLAVTVSPPSATLDAGTTTVFTASGEDQYTNPVDVSGATWSTDVTGASVSGTTPSGADSQTTFSSGSIGGSGRVTATVTIGAVTKTGSAAVTVYPVLSFTSGPQTLTAGVASSPLAVQISSPLSGPLTIDLSSDSTGVTAFSPAQVTIDAGQTVSQQFTYSDTKAGTPTVTATASSLGNESVTQQETVEPDLSSLVITVSPPNATVPSGGSQPFTASGEDQYANPVDLSAATWSSADLTDYTLSTTTGASTVFTAGTTAETGSLTVAFGGASASVGVTVSVPSLAAPTNLTAAARGKHIALSWTASSGAATYDIYRASSDPSGTYQLVGSGGSGTSFNDKSVASGTTYWYYVTAVNAAGTVESPPSKTAFATAR